MPVLEDFVASLRRHAVGGLADLDALPVVLTRAAVEVLDVDGASLSLVSESIRMPLGADSPASTRAEQLQFTLGEGPCLEIYRTGRPSSYDAGQVAARWPVYASELHSSTPFRSCSSTPIDLGDSLLAALDLYSTSERAASDVELADITLVTEQIQHQLRRHATDADVGPSWLRSDSMRRRANVWIALALAATVTGIAGSDALTVMRAYAFSSQVTLDEVTRRIAARELDIRTVLDRPDGQPDQRPPSPRGGELGHEEG